MGRKLVISGVVVALLFPFISIVGMVAHFAMGCTGGGSSGPVAGCHVLGVEFNFIAAMATPAFVASFFAIPLGIVLVIIGAITSAFSSPKDELPVQSRRDDDNAV